MKQEIIQHINQLVREGEPFLFVINYHGDKVYIKKLSEIDAHECLYDFDGKTNTKDLSPKACHPKSVGRQWLLPFLNMPIALIL